MSTKTLPNGALLLRGPLLVAIVLGFLLYPYVASLSTSTLVNLGILVLGFCLTAWDFTRVFKKQFRKTVRKALDSVILDDLLKSLYDPETGLFAVLITTVVGNATMYALPMTQDHRLRLMKSCLWTSDEQTKRMMTDPGGIKEFLPESTKRWLEEDDDDEEEEHSEDEGVVKEKTLAAQVRTARRTTTGKSAEDRSVDVGTVVTVPDEDSANDRVQTGRSTAPQGTSRPLDFDRMVSATMKPTPNADNDEPEEEDKQNERIKIPPQFEDPLVAMGEILKDIGLGVWKRHVQASLPSTRVLHSVGFVAGTGLIIHLRTSSLARKLLRGVLEGTLALGLAGTAATAFAAGAAGEPRSIDLLRSVTKDPTGQGAAFLDAMISLVSRHVMTRWKAVVALAVLAMAGQLRALLADAPRRRRRR